MLLDRVVRVRIKVNKWPSLQLEPWNQCLLAEESDRWPIRGNRTREIHIFSCKFPFRLKKSSSCLIGMYSNRNQTEPSEQSSTEAQIFHAAIVSSHSALFVPFCISFYLERAKNALRYLLINTIVLILK